MVKKIFFDLNWETVYHENSLAFKSKGAFHESRTKHIFSNNQLLPAIRISKMCESPQRRLQNQTIHLLRTVFNHGFCATNLSGKLARYRNMLQRHAKKDVSLWHSKQGFKKHFGRSKPKSIMENLWRFCTCINKQNKKTLLQRFISTDYQSSCICDRFNHNQSLFIIVSMVEISLWKRCGQSAYSIESKRGFSRLFSHYECHNLRSRYFRFFTNRSRRILHHGQRLFRFVTFVFARFTTGFFRNATQNKCQISSTVFRTSKQRNGFTMRPNNCLYQLHCTYTLPGKAQTYQILRRRKTRISEVLNERFLARCLNDCRTVQSTLENRIILPVAKTTLKNQIFLWHLGERSQNTSSNSNVCLFACRNNQKAA